MVIATGKKKKSKKRSELLGASAIGSTPSFRDRWAIRDYYRYQNRRAESGVDDLLDSNYDHVSYPYAI